MRRAAAGTLVSAHRGGGEDAPRGSLAAYESAVAMGADLVEADVRRRADGVLCCAHDAVAVDSPTLDEVLALCASGGVGMHVDCKETGYEAELVAAVFAVLTPATCYFTTGDDAAVAALRAASDDCQALLTLGPSFAGRSVLEAGRDLWRAAVPFARLDACGAQGAAAQFRLATWALRWWCRRRGFAVLVWTVNEDWRIRRLLRLRGVTAVVTDRPRRALALR